MADFQEEEYIQSEDRNENPDFVGVDPDNLDTKKKSSKKKWKKEPSIDELRTDLEFARQETTDQKSNVEGWLDLRNATGSEAPRRAKPGRSAVQPKLIRKHNEWRYPALTEPFLNTDKMFEVLPRTFEDGPKAKQNEVLLNWQFDTKINKVDFIDRYVRTAVDEGSVIVRVGWEQEFMTKEVETVEYDYFPIEDEGQAEMVMTAIQMFELGVPDWEGLPESLKASAEMSLELQIPVEAVESGITTTVEEVMVNNAPSLRIINVANLFVDPSCDGEWENAQFMIYTYEASPSDLRKKKEHFYNLDQVNWDAAKIQGQHGNPDHETSTPNTDFRGTSDKQKVLVYEYWGLYDIHDTGVMVPIVVTWVADTIIQMQENPFPDGKPPFVIVPYMPILNSVFGESDASLLQDNQRIVGAVTRGMIDLMGRSANAQTGYAKGFLDPVNKRRFSSGEDFEFNPNGDPRMNIQQMTYPEIPRSAYDTITLQNQEAESLTGVKSFSGGISGDAYGKVATGIRGAMDSAAIREMSILRRLAKGMQDIGRKIVSMNATFLSDKEVIRVTNTEFVKVSKEELEGDFDLKVDISTASVEEQRAMDLGFVLQTVGPDMDPSLRSIILAEIADLKRMPDLAQQIRSYQPEPDPLEMALKEAEIMKMQSEAALNEARAQEAQARASALLAGTSADISGIKHSRDLEKMTSQARGNQDLEITKALLKGETPPPLIEAAVGHNALSELKDRVKAQEGINKSQQDMQMAQQAAEGQQNLGQGFDDPGMIPPEYSGQEGQAGPLSVR